jgi:hypothetical protein
MSGGFFGLALALYFASQGAGRLFWPLSAGFLRMLVASPEGLRGAAERRAGSAAGRFIPAASRDDRRRTRERHAKEYADRGAVL